MIFLNRIYKVTAFLQPQVPPKTATMTQYFAESRNAVEITAMRVEFKVEKTLSKDPSTAEVSISNLSETSRAEFQQRPLKVKLEAGHDNVSRLLFIGDVRPGSSSKLEGTEWITHLLLGDGSRAFAHGRLSRSYTGGTSVKTVLRDAAGAMGLSLPKELDANSLGAIPVGESLSGFASDELTRLLAAYGFDWSIQNGQLQVLKADAVLPRIARVISADTGMLGTPELGTPEKGKKPPTLTVKHILDGSFAPGQLIKVVSKAAGVSGLYKILRVVHTGDTHGQTWETEIEAKPQ